ncbi:hydrolase [Novosphingobium sediminicola]|uniref:Glutamate carboxypeptidase n=1 Tax=Novosphingobium sediminicola TaxID=563162 RepID=A0A7W6CLH9_9SPHN|nr:hydrolase [Novosphingobium sediminicola]MBB3953677.1 glutamate carboxypeptidase [Novosphingobium sediminicola]
MTPTERAVVDRAMAAPMLDQVLRWAAINSGSGNLAGLAAMASELTDACAPLPGAVELLDPAPVTRIDAQGRECAVVHGRNLLLTVRPTAPVQILLTGHMDTVFDTNHPFQTCQWLRPGVLNGPGVADMKGGLAVMIAALHAFETSPECERLGYQVVFNSDEEVGSPGSAALLARAAAGKLAGLTYEPSALPDGTLAGARPGSGNFSLVVTGRSAHAGRNPQDGRNAVVAAADLALRLSALVRPGLSVNCARIEGGGPNNVVPDHAVLRVNIRPRTRLDEALASEALDRIIAQVAAAHDLHIHRHGSFARPPKPVNARGQRLLELVRDCGRMLGQEIGWKDSGGVCDGNNIAACGVPVVDTMGVRGGAIHSPDEYLIADSLGERAALSALLLCRLARDGL